VPLDLDSLLQKTLITPKKTNRSAVKPEGAFQDTAVKPGFENVKI
jgi:hypothetical protein